MRALSGELSYRIGYDVEHDLFHAQNVFNDEYIKPTFIEYVQKLEKENADLRASIENTRCAGIELLRDKRKQLINAKEIIKQLMRAIPYGSGKLATESYDKAEQFLENNA